MRCLTSLVIFSASAAADCLWKNVGFLNNGIVKEDVKDLDACRSLCREEKSCIFWSYDWAKQQCNLHPEKSFSTAYFKQNSVAGMKECCSDACENGFSYTDIPAENESECRLLCYADDGCIQHLYTNGTCILKYHREAFAKVTEKCCGMDCPAPVISPCIEPNTRYYSPDYDTKLKAPSFYDCVEKCRSTDGCKAVTYHLNSDCYLKSNATAQIYRQHCEDCISVRMDCCAEAGMKVSGKDYVLLENVDNRRECEKQCLLRDACLGFTYNTATKQCDMKNETIYHEVSHNKNDIAGQRYCCDDDGLKYNSDSTIVDAESVYQCRLQCQATEGCEAFTFTRADRKCALQKKGFKTSLFPALSDGVSGPKTCWKEYGYSWPVQSFDLTPLETVEACQRSCATNDKCNNWVADTGCHLKYRSDKRYQYALNAVQYFKGY